MKKTLSSVVDITAKQTHPMRQQLLRPHQAIAERMFAGDEESTTKHFDAEDNIGKLVGIVSVFNTQHPKLHHSDGKYDLWRLHRKFAEKASVKHELTALKYTAKYNHKKFNHLNFGQTLVETR